ncbi:DNA-primase RepB domain-containing protein [Bradyrhizobium sp. LA2.1]|uniref:DNA-primase RepB domain-containing protein n=1 Tax=Bradyrhizobium sp. LA2.1 TaxID=3156376 RepID=UPI003391AE68
MTALHAAKNDYLDPIRTHCEMLHGLAQGIDGVLVVSAYNVAGGKGTITHHRPGDIDGMVAAIAAHSDTSGTNVYVGLHLMRRGLLRGKRGTKEDVLAVLGLVADMDSDTGKTGKLPFEPSFTIETSPGNQQPVWIFDKPLTVAEAAPLAAALKRATGSDHGTADVDHVWRIPGTNNWPNRAKLERGRSPDPASVHYLQAWDGDLISVDAFRQALAPWASAPASEAKPVQLGELPDVNGITVSDKLAAMLAANDVGDRSDYAAAVVEKMAFYGHSAEEAASLFMSAPGNWFARYPNEAAAVRDFERMWGKDRARRDVWSQWMKVASDLTAMLLVSFANDNASGATQRREHAKKLTGHIKVALSGLLPPHVKDAPEEFAVDADAVERIVGGTFWDAKGSKLYMVNPGDQSLVLCSIADAKTFIKRSHGYPVDVEAAGSVLAQWLPIDPKTDPISAGIKQVSAIVHKHILDHLKYHNQRSSIEYRVDMFADTARVELLENRARVVLTHKRLTESRADGTEIVGDYKQHFPELDAVIEFIVAARFAGDRKKAYLWLLADSDWGKGFLLGVLRELGISVEMSVREIEAFFEGKPVGRSPTDFTRAFVLSVDEFKAVKSEIKQLQSTIPLAPKFQMTSEVEVFAKLFTSAEQVRSLVGEHGVEDQFANRFSLIEKSGSIEDRDIFSRDKDRYHRVVTAYVARELNCLIDTYIQLGRDSAQKRGRDVLDAFIGEHGIARSHGRVSEAGDDIAADFIAWVREREQRKSEVLFRKHAGSTYLPAAGALFSEYVKERVDPSERATISKKVGTILKSICPDRKGSAVHRIPERTRAIRLKLGL